MWDMTMEDKVVLIFGDNAVASDQDNLRHLCIKYNS